MSTRYRRWPPQSRDFQHTVSLSSLLLFVVVLTYVLLARSASLLLALKAVI